MRGASGAGGYQISRSLRFNAADSNTLTRTPVTTGSRTTYSLSFWIKNPFTSGSDNPVWGQSSIARESLAFQGFSYAHNPIQWIPFTGFEFRTTQAFRDNSAWYHVVAVGDSTNATAGDRARLYINGVRVTAFDLSSTITQNAQTGQLNTAVLHYIGQTWSSDGALPRFYLTEMNFIDGQALTPSSFGETNAQTGVWQPKAYSGSYGTNGFYLNFSDNSNTTAATLGKDYSGNGNNWTPNNFSVTAGAGNDSVVDSPTPYGTDTGVGGEVRGNYATLNPLHGVATSGAFYLTNGNLDLNVLDNSGYRNFAATISPEGFKGYCEVRMATDPNFQIGFAFESILPSNTQYQTNPPNAFYMSGDGNFRSGQTVVRSAYTPSFASGDILQIAFDFTGGARNIWFGRNGTWGTSAAGLGVPATGTNPIFTVSDLSQACRLYFGINTGAGTVTINTNFGQRPFAYTAPTGFKALCTRNLPVPTIGATTATQAGKYFNTVLYTGNGTTQTISGVGFQPDFLWVKSRSNAYWHSLLDVVRGRAKTLFTNVTNAEFTSASDKEVTAFTSDGFSLGPDDNYSINSSGATFVAWNWKAGSSTVTNTAGTITSQVSANPTSGFSIVTYTGNSIAGATRGHGLNALPKMMFIKGRTGTYGADNWHVYHAALPNTQGFALNTDGGATTSEYFWNNTSPSTTVFTTSTGASNNDSGTTYVAYCWSEVEGFSKFGSYTANGSANGPFVYTGFRPAWILFKGTGNGTNWFLFDAKRSTYNIVINLLYPNAANAENTAGSGYVDLTSNGFKVRTTAGDMNSSGTYVYACFAENPFKYSLAR